MNKEEEDELIKVGGQQLLKTPLASANGGETPSASQQQVQCSTAELQRLLQDEQLAKESQLKVRTDTFCVSVAAFCCSASACLSFSHKPVTYLRFA